jgi:hypothetical protein
MPYNEIGSREPMDLWGIFILKKNKMSYQKKLQNPKWQKKRLEILQRDDFKCQSCGADNEELHVHHKWYEYGKDIWDYENECFQTLCHLCHNEIELHLKEILVDIVMDLRKSVIIQPDYTCILNLLNSISYKSEYASYNPYQVMDAIDYIVTNDVIGQIIEMRSKKFK